MNKERKHPYHPDFLNEMSVEDFMDAMSNDNRFKHLQIFLSKKEKAAIGDLFLLTSRNGFSIVRLINLNYQNEKIIFDLLDVEADKLFRLPISIHERQFQYLFLKLDDIRNMIREIDKTEAEYHFDEGDCTNKDIEDLLELDEARIKNQ
jgi:hypothetical protein